MDGLVAQVGAEPLEPVLHAHAGIVPAAEWCRVVGPEEVDAHRPGVHPPGHLEGAEEPDLSVTPFCNTFPIRRTPDAPGASLTLDTAFIDAAVKELLAS